MSTDLELPERVAAPYIRPDRFFLFSFFFFLVSKISQGEYWDGSKNDCVLCADAALNPEGLNCDSQGTLLETLPLANGYWRSIITTTVSIVMAL